MGKDLLKTVVTATGLPEDPVQRELSTLLKANGKCEESMTIEDLREIMAEYLQTVFLEAKESFN